MAQSPDPTSPAHPAGENLTQSTEEKSPPPFTPGPWIVVKSDFHRMQVRGLVTNQFPQGGRPVCEWLEHRRGAKRGEQVQWTGWTEEEEANALVISFVPLLLRFVQAFLKWNDSGAEIPAQLRYLATDLDAFAIEAASILRSLGVRL